MGFRCDVCNEPQPPGTQPIKIVTATRDKEYFSAGELILGHEIKKEIGVCSSCEGTVDKPGHENISIGAALTQKEENTLLTDVASLIEAHSEG